MESPLRPRPDYGANPHNMSTDWWHDAAVDTSVSPEELAFFEELREVSQVGPHQPQPHDGSSKKALPSSYAQAVEGGESPSILPHTPAEPDGTGKNRDNLTPFAGLGQLVVKKGFLEETTQALQKVQQEAEKATKSLQETAKQTPGASTSTPTTATPPPTTTTTSTPAAKPPATTPAPATPPPATAQGSQKPANPTGTTYGKGASLAARAHTAWFQSNPYMQYNNPSPMNPAGQYNDMNYNPRPSYFEEGTGDSSFQNLHANPNGNYSRESLTYGGITDLLTAPPADPRWTAENPDFDKFLPMTESAKSYEGGDASAPLIALLDDLILHAAKRLSTDDNPYIRDYAETRPLNNNVDSVNAPDVDPNNPQDMRDLAETMHQTQPRIRGVGQQGPKQEFEPTNKGLIAPPDGMNKTVGTFIETSSPSVPPSASGNRFNNPGYKSNRPISGMEALDFFKDH